MADIGVITGSGFYELDEVLEAKIVKTEYGSVSVDTVEIEGKQIAHIARHGKKHEVLSPMIDHRANIAALSTLGVKIIIGTTVCGITNKEIQLGKLLLFTDLFFPDNRLPNGELCTFFTKSEDKKRGHYLFEWPFNRETIQKLKRKDIITDVTYGHVNGPRFNSKAEIAWISLHADAISQTCGPEAVLSGELEIPYMLLGYGVDYANGIQEIPTPIEALQQHIADSKKSFNRMITRITALDLPTFEGYVYRFE